MSPAGDLRSRELMRRERYALTDRPRRMPQRLRWAGRRSRRRRRRQIMFAVAVVLVILAASLLLGALPVAV